MDVAAITLVGCLSPVKSLLSARLSYDRRTQILREKFNVTTNAVHLMSWLSEAVVLARIDDKLNRHFLFLERLIKLLRLGDGNAGVDLAVHDHCRGLHVLHVLHGRTVPIKFLR